MNKTFSYRVLNETAYHQKLDTWFLFIFVGIIYASVRNWFQPESGVVEAFVRTLLPLQVVISVIWIFGFFVSFTIYLLVKDIRNIKAILNESFKCSIHILDICLFKRLFQETTYEKTIVVQTTPYGQIYFAGDFTSSLWTNVVTFENNSILSLVFNRK